jgi:hypothetical protein
MTVLFVTGDYYDLNVISQINIIADVDTAIQFLGGTPSGDGGFEQFASAGGNTLTNTASIVDVGPLAEQFLGGDYYEDIILIQANIVTDDSDDVTYGEVETLVGEVIAFIGAPEGSEAAETDFQSSDPNHHHNGDVMGSIVT